MKQTDQRLPIWLGALTGSMVVLILGVIIGLAALSADVARLDEQVTALKYGGQINIGSASLSGVGSDRKPSTTPGSSAGANFKAQIDGLKVLSCSLEVDLTVQFSGPADLLYLLPIVQGAKGTTYAVTPESLKAARLAFLDLTTRGQATARLVFQPAPSAQEALTLVFNPEMPSDDVVAPRIEVVLRRRE